MQDWDALFAAVVSLEQPFLPTSVEFVEALGFNPGSDVAVATMILSNSGTLPITGSIPLPGDCALVVRYATTKKSVKNHTVFVFSYYHGVRQSSAATNGDQVWGSQFAPFDASSQLWVDGFSAAGRQFRRTTPDGHLVTGHTCDPNIGHRDFVNR